MTDSPRSKFQLHLSTLLILTVIASLLLVADFQIYDVTRPSLDTFKEPSNLIGLLFCLALEALMLVVPYCLLEARIRRQSQGRPLTLKRNTWIAVLVIAIVCLLINIGVKGFPFGLYGGESELNTTALGLNMFCSFAFLVGVGALLEKFFE